MNKQPTEKSSEILALQLKHAVQAGKWAECVRLTRSAESMSLMVDWDLSHTTRLSSCHFVPETYSRKFHQSARVTIGVNSKPGPPYRGAGGHWSGGGYSVYSQVALTLSDADYAKLCKALSKLNNETVA